MLDSVISYLRQLIGDTSGFWHTFQNNNTNTSYNWDYGLLFEYFIAGVIVCLVISNVFKFLRALIS